TVRDRTARIGGTNVSAEPGPQNPVSRTGRLPEAMVRTNAPTITGPTALIRPVSIEKHRSRRSPRGATQLTRRPSAVGCGHRFRAQEGERNVSAAVRVLRRPR